MLAPSVSTIEMTGVDFSNLVARCLQTQSEKELRLSVTVAFNEYKQLGEACVTKLIAGRPAPAYLSWVEKLKRFNFRLVSTLH